MFNFFIKMIKKIMSSYFGLDSEQGRREKWDNPEWWLEKSHSTIFGFLDFLTWYDDDD